MTPITLESIKADADALASKIATFEAQAGSKAVEFYFPETTIELRPGEHYAGLIIGKDGEPSYHLVLLPGQADDISWDKAMAWAAQRGSLDASAGLPTRREQALLYANLKDQFEDHAYWSCEAHESGWAWSQGFYNGDQSGVHKSHDLRARAVRRLIIE
ncbi:DUF1566 domain-containing protein [Dechloromonas sp. TW-R-39-2]|uniref:DUF1566 domain-containing protein n=1 Tax=Dechloromonas sp. TW-R-39-2 TaxID=2654218 RepID=UPI00193CC45A|nr:DUF1566 domain-containing protein [Dechloromonas sp. TW-R-39-2]QRM19534.1 DUF1566 domain-containing protein [Dechloromonas sp. TW-R-39-2]